MLYVLSSAVGLGIISLFLFFLLASGKGRRSLILSVRSLWLHKLRAFLSVLGIIIGTSAVISLMAFGEGSMQDTLADIGRQGATNVIIRSVKPPDDASSQRRTMIANYGLTYADYERFLTVPTVSVHVPMRVFPVEARRLEKMANGRLVATTAGYAEVHNVDVVAGRFLTEDEDLHMANVAVLGSALADKLFPFENPIGQTVRLGQYFYEVVGVLDDRMPTGGSGGSQAAEEFNDDVYIPLNTCKVRFGEKIFVRTSGSRSAEQVQLSQVTLTIADQAPFDKVRRAGEMMRELLERHHLKQDWAVTIPLDRLEEAKRAQQRYTMLLVFIASISLIVGGIGIMNIMLATVTERTREIGIRRGLGAKRRDITLQFLIEAMVQTTLGGLLGVLLGLSVVYAAPHLARWIAHAHLPAALNVGSIFLSLFVSISVGVLFGWYPARRASLLDIIEALRHE
jgi:putative ABC transport system permease protein